MKISCDIIAYGGWAKCVRISDGRTELVVTTDVGPRIMRYGKPGGINLLKEYRHQLGRRGGKTWRIYGGHRLWIAPEDRKRTYVPDNKPVEWTWNGRVLTVSQEPDGVTHLAKSLRIMYTGRGLVRIEHQITNRGRRQAHFAPWALTVMAPGGEAVFPQEPYRSHRVEKLPARPLVLWPYTNMSDVRWTWGARELRLRQDTAATAPQKVGFLSTQGWMAYRLDRQAFVKGHTFQAGATYPDFGCNVETFTNEEMLELETLGPLLRLKPGATATHVEQWGLFSSPGAPSSAALSGWAAKVRHGL